MKVDVMAECDWIVSTMIIKGWGPHSIESFDALAKCGSEWPFDLCAYSHDFMDCTDGAAVRKLAEHALRTLALRFPVVHLPAKDVTMGTNGPDASMRKESHRRLEQAWKDLSVFGSARAVVHLDFT